MEENDLVHQILREEGAIQLGAALQQDGDDLARCEGREHGVEIETAVLRRDPLELVATRPEWGAS